MKKLFLTFLLATALGGVLTAAEASTPVASAATNAVAAAAAAAEPAKKADPDLQQRVADREA
jgi:hypothetical protein